MHVAEVLERLSKAGMTLQFDKCLFARPTVEYLGHIVSGGGITADPKKIKAVQKWKQPTTVTEVRSFLGLASYYRHFVPQFAQKAEPLHRLTKGAKGEKRKPVVWGADAQRAFDELKVALTTAPCLAYPDYSKPFYLGTDASDVAMGGVMYQCTDEGQEQPLAYWSRTFNSAQRKYGVTQRECLALVEALQHYRPYVYGRPVQLVTDHSALQWLMTVKDPHGRLARWALALAEFDLRITYKAGRLHTNADGLSRRVEKLKGTVCEETGWQLEAVERAQRRARLRRAWEHAGGTPMEGVSEVSPWAGKGGVVERVELAAHRRRQWERFSGTVDARRTLLREVRATYEPEEGAAPVLMAGGESEPGTRAWGEL